ncbi:hypothetical protein DFH08DRAFT_794155 [Mycena albidolilacea]|uniref:Uncharacterized protein n=1 Tax=Mycena albidolilacea TaxID=1033008 RepID=A0AAD6Z1T7_9AGAR|nr:hypothetical protein DFH08DRAFT_794155 [Mycena albidolilacea]
MSADGLTGRPRPSWPSLYNPGIELLHIVHHEAVQPDGAYLSEPFDIFRFTLYWTLIFYTPIFLCCGLYAFINLTFPPSRPSHANAPKRAEASEADDASSYPLTPLLLRPYSPRDTTAPLLRPPKPKPNQGRSRTTFALLVLLAFLLLSVAGALLSSAIIGFILAGVYKLAKFNLSTWIPFLWALISVLVGILSVWPSVIDII